jgi:hypothetical protein
LGTKVRFYLDENVQIAIAEQLKRRRIDAITVRDLGLLGDEDINHLERATELGRVLCTHDADYIDLATSGKDHTGIVFAQQHKHSIGVWVAFLERLHNKYDDAEKVHNVVEYVKAL